MNYVWKDDDLEYIKNNYPYNVSLKEVAEKYNTSIGAVNRITTKLGCDECPIELRNQRSGESRRIFTKNVIIARIKEMHKNGEQLNSDFVQKEYGSFFVGACGLFGSWKQAIVGAGFDYSKINLYAHRIHWEREKIIDEILKLNEDGVDISISNIRDNYGALFSGAKREYAGETKYDSFWEHAINDAGLNYIEICGDSWGTRSEGKDGKAYVSRLEAKVADLLFDLKNESKIKDYYSQVPISDEKHWRCDFLIEIKKKKLLYIEVDGLRGARKGNSHKEKLKFLENSGLEYGVITKAEQALDAIKHYAKKRIINTYDYERRFVELGETRYTEEEIIDELKRVAIEIGRTPTQVEFSKFGTMSSGTVSLRIGWYDALERAKLKPLIKKRVSNHP